MKYLARNTDINVITLVFEMPVQTTPPLELVEVPNDQYQLNMLNSIFIDVDNYKPYPSVTEGWWESNGTDWVDSRADAEVWDYVRTKRNKELAESDWTQLEDTPLTSLKKGLWTTYRAELRDIPNNNIDNPRAAEKSLEDVIQGDRPGV